MGRNVEKENLMVDILKFFAAICVIAIHTSPFSFSQMLDQTAGVITSLAVPYFFIAAVYYFYKNHENTKEYICNNLSES